MNIDAPPPHLTHLPLDVWVIMGWWCIPSDFATWPGIFTCKDLNRAKNAIAANLSAPPQPNSFLYPTSSASTCLGLQFHLYFSPSLLNHHLIHLGAASRKATDFGPKIYWFLGPKFNWLAIWGPHFTNYRSMGPKFYWLAISKVPHWDPLSC